MPRPTPEERAGLTEQRTRAHSTATAALWACERITEWIEAGELSESSTIQDVMARLDREHHESNDTYEKVTTQLFPPAGERPTLGQYNGLRMLAAGPEQGLGPGSLPRGSVTPMERKGWVEVYRTVPEGGHAEHVLVRITESGRKALADY
jgi:hypothetical protein